MKKKMLSLMLAGMMVVGLCACGAKKEETKADSAQVTDEVATAVADKDNEFVVGFDQEFPPMGFVDENGEFTGFDLELAAEAAKRMGMELKLQPIAWDAKDMELESGTIDCIWNGFTMSEDRLNQYEWSDAYVDNSQVFIVKSGSGIATQADLAGKIVAVQAASSALEALEAEESAALLGSFKELIQVPDYNTAFMYLESGAAEAIAMDIGVAKFQMAERGADKFVILDEKLVSELYGVGFLKGNTELRDQVQETLYEMVKDGKFDEIAKKWGLEDSVVLGK